MRRRDLRHAESGAAAGTLPSVHPGLAALLADLRRELDVPLPARTRILNEVAADAEGLFGELLRRGWSEAAAAARVRELLLPGDEARVALHRLHAPLYQRIAERFSPATMQRWERVLLAVTVAGAVLGGAAALATIPVFERRSPFLLPVMASGSLGLLLALAKVFQLFVKGVRDEAGLRRGMATLLGASAVTSLASLLGLLVDLYRLAARLEAAHDPTGGMAFAFLVADGTLLAVGLTLSLAVALAWFLLLQWIAALESAERASL